MDQFILDLIQGRKNACRIGAVESEVRPPQCLLSGSFNPLHPGHLAMADYASQTYNELVEFELSISNVDKPTLTLEQVRERAQQFDDAGLWLTRAPTFVQKAQLFPKCRFVVGADTAIRLFDSKYYANEAAVSDAIAVLAELETRFLVFGRLMDDHFVASASLPIPAKARSLFDFVPEIEFRMDVSSTELRGKRKKD